MKKRQRWQLIFPAVLLFLVNGPLSTHINLVRKERGMTPPIDIMLLYLNMPPEAVTIATIGAMFGGFRGVAARMLWIKSDEYWHSGRWYTMIPIMQTITWLDPNYIEAWDMAGWHMAYNLRAEEKTRERQEYWVREGIKVYKEGIRWNPERPELFFQLGWTYYDKGGDLSDQGPLPQPWEKTGGGVREMNEAFLQEVLQKEGAATFFREASKREKLKKGELDRTRHLIAHAYERLPDIPKAIEVWWDVAQRYLKDNSPATRQQFARAKKLMETGHEKEAEAILLRIILPIGGTAPIGPLVTIHQRYVKPWKLMEQGRFEEAIKLMEPLLKEHPYNSIHRHVLAKIYERKGDLEAAIAILEEWANTNKMDAAAPFKAKQLRALLRQRKRLKKPGELSERKAPEASAKDAA